jgi:hypothetical protein
VVGYGASAFALRASADKWRPDRWADENPGVGSKSLRGPVLCHFDRQIVQPACMPKERFPHGVFSVKIFPQLGVI